MKLPVALILLPLFFSVSCVSTSSEGDKTKTDEDLVASIQEIDYLIPSPGEILEAIHQHGLEYHSELLSPIVKSSDFILYRNRALNFGVYLTDFSYLLLFEKQSEAIRYLYLIQELSTVLGIETYFDDEFFNELLHNLSDSDTIKSMSIDQSAQFFSNMERTGNLDLVLYVTSGALIEVIFLTSHLLDEKTIDEATVAAIVDHAEVFGLFYERFASFQSLDTSTHRLLSDLKELNEIFLSLKLTKVPTKEMKDGRIHISSTTNHEISEFNIRKLKVLTNSIRHRIVNQEY